MKRTGAVQLVPRMAVQGQFNAAFTAAFYCGFHTTRKGLHTAARSSPAPDQGFRFADLSRSRLANTPGRAAVVESSDLLRADNGFIGEETHCNHKRCHATRRTGNPAPDQARQTERCTRFEKSGVNSEATPAPGQDNRRTRNDRQFAAMAIIRATTGDFPSPAVVLGGRT